MEKVKYLLCALLLSILLTGVVKAEGPYYLEYETDLKDNMVFNGNYQYQDGIIAFDNDQEKEQAVITTYNSKGEVKKTKDFAGAFVYAIKTNGDNIYIYYSESSHYYLGYLDSNLNLIRKVAVEENDVYVMFIHEDVITFKDNKVYIAEEIYDNPQTNKTYLYFTGYKNDLTKREELNLPVDEAVNYFPDIIGTLLNETNMGRNILRGFDAKDDYLVLTYGKRKESCLNHVSPSTDPSGSVFNSATTEAVGQRPAPFLPPLDKECNDLKIAVYKNNLSNSKWEKDINEYNDATEVRAFKDFIVVIGTKEFGSDILLYDYEGNLIQKITSNKSEYYNIVDKENGFIVSNEICPQKKGRSISCQTNHQVYYMYHKIEYKITDGKGKIEVTNRQKAGEPVKFTVIPDEGYELGVVKVTDVNGKTVTFTDYTFTMPSADVTIEVTFVKKKVNPKTADIAIILATSVAIITATIVFIQYRKTRLIK